MSLKDRMLGEDSDKLSVEQIWAFLDATDEVGLLARDRIEIYAWVNRTLRHHDYAKLPRADKGSCCALRYSPGE